VRTGIDETGESKVDTIKVLLLILGVLLLPAQALGGPYPPAAGQQGSTAVYMDDPAFSDWAVDYVNYIAGGYVDSTWQTLERALGKAVGDAFDIVSLGRGGEITLVFDPPIKNGEGWDFAVFENSFSDTFLELAYVEVSSDGISFVRFDNDSLTSGPVGGYGAIDPTNVSGFAGKYRQAYGMPFDLQDLAEKDGVISGTVNLARISYVKIIDVVGDGTYVDSSSDVIYDPYPTFSSAGFDLDAIGARYVNTTLENTPPLPPTLISPGDGSKNVALTPTLEIGPFSDPDPGDTHLLTKWQISTLEDFSGVIFEALSKDRLTSLSVPLSTLVGETTYYWRAQVYDGEGDESDWPEPSEFETTKNLDDGNGNKIPDDQEIEVDWDDDGITDPEIVSVKAVNTEGKQVLIGLEKGANVASVLSLQAVDPDATETTNRPDNLPSGLVSFKIQVVDSDIPAQVTVYLSEPGPNGAGWYKYDTIHGWSEYPHASFSGKFARVELQLKDGLTEFGDVDGVQNGTIVDPGGVGFTASSTPPPSGNSGIDGGGCFVQAASQRLSQQLHLIVTLMVFLAILLLMRGSSG
jgi:hypothetical protein